MVWKVNYADLGRTPKNKGIHHGSAVRVCVCVCVCVSAACIFPILFINLLYSITFSLPCVIHSCGFPLDIGPCCCRSYIRHVDISYHLFPSSCGCHGHPAFATPATHISASTGSTSPILMAGRIRSLRDLMVTSARPRLPARAATRRLDRCS